MELYLIIKEDEDETTRKIIDHIADHIDDVIKKFDVRIKPVKDIFDVPFEWNINSLPCAHLSGVNYHSRREIMQILNTGKPPLFEEDSFLNRQRRELQEMSPDQRTEIREEYTQNVVDAERDRRIMEDRARRDKFREPMSTKKTPPIESSKKTPPETEKEILTPMSANDTLARLLSD